MEDEVDLRDYVNVLLRRWKLIVTITGVAVLIAGLFSFLSAPVYEASAGVLITRTRAEIVFEPKYRTVLEEDVRTRHEALVGLVKSSSVATDVIEQLGEQLRPEERRVTGMLNRVEVAEQGDLLKIGVKSSDPQKAADIANAWGTSYERYINGLYTGIAQSPEEIRAQADSARQEYELKQEAWEEFVQDNRMDELRRHISDKELLCDLKSFRAHLESGETGSATATADNLAAMVFQARAFSGLPSNMEMSMEELSGLEVTPADVGALIATLEDRSGTPAGRSVEALRQEILELRAELEQESAREQELRHARDLAWDTYSTLASKAEEVSVATHVEGAVVRVAAPAVLPESPVAPRRLMNMGIALVLGAVVSVLAAFAVEYFSRPQRRRA